MIIVRPTIEPPPPEIIAASNSTGGGSSFAVTLPTGSGGTLFLFVASDGARTHTTATSGWTKQGQSDTGNDTFSWFTADGGAAAPTIALGASEDYAWRCYRLEPVNLTQTQHQFATGAPTTPCPEIATGSARWRLWMIPQAWWGNSETPDNPPSGWDNWFRTTTGGAGGIGLTIATLTSRDATVTPTAATGGSQNWAGATIAIAG